MCRIVPGEQIELPAYTHKWKIARQLYGGYAWVWRVGRCWREDQPGVVHTVHMLIPKMWRVASVEAGGGRREHIFDSAGSRASASGDDLTAGGPLTNIAMAISIDFRTLRR